MNFVSAEFRLLPDQGLCQFNKDPSLECNCHLAPIFEQFHANVRDLRRGKTAGPDGINAETLQSLGYVSLYMLGKAFMYHSHLCAYTAGASVAMTKTWKRVEAVILKKPGGNSTSNARFIAKIASQALW